MKTSEQIHELTSAMAKARGEFPPIEKGRTADTGKFNYDYADLADILDATAPALSKHGLVLSQDVYSEGGSVAVVTRLEHESGQWKESSPLAIPCASDGRMGLAQSMGSAETYLRRYQAVAMLGVQPRGEDDDGHAASGQDAQTTQRRREPSPDCPKCGTNEHVIKGKEEYGGGWLCWKSKGGCGEKWQTVKELAEQTGMTTGDKIPPKNGQPATEELDQAREYSERFASVWSGESLKLLGDELRNKLASGEITAWVKSEAVKSGELAKRRVEIASKANWRNEEIDNMLRDLANVKGLDDFDEWLAIKHPGMEPELFERFTNERNRVADKLMAVT